MKLKFLFIVLLLTSCQKNDATKNTKELIIKEFDVTDVSYIHVYLQYSDMNNQAFVMYKDNKKIKTISIVEREDVNNIEETMYLSRGHYKITYPRNDHIPKEEFFVQFKPYHFHNNLDKNHPLHLSNNSLYSEMIGYEDTKYYTTNAHKVEVISQEKPIYVGYDGMTGYQNIRLGRYRSKTLNLSKKDFKIYGFEGAKVIIKTG